MQSQKKHKRPKIERVQAKEYAIGFAANAGGKVSAEASAKKMALDAGPDKKLANFWTNIAGHIAKFAN